MTARAATFKQCDVERAIRSVKAVGLPVSAVEITRDGSIRVLTSAPPDPSNDTEDWADLAGETKAPARA